MIQRNKERETLGERLRRRREDLGFSTAQIAREIQAPARYIQSLEEDTYEIFPAKVYALGFLKKFLAAVSFPDQENLLKEFASEWEVRMFRKNQKFTTLPKQNSENIYLTPQRIGFILGLVALLLLILVFGVQFVRFVASPAITINEPADAAVFDSPLIHVKGRTEKESQLTMNGREITIDGSGNFDEEIELGSGLNTLEFFVKDRFGKESKVVRYVLVK